MFNDLLLNLVTNLTYDLLKTSITRLRDVAFGDVEQQALRRVYERAFAAMLKAMIPSDDQDTLMRLDSVLRPLLQSPDVSNRLMDIALVEDYRPSIANLRARFESASRELDHDLASLASIQADLDVGLDAFIRTLIEALHEEAERPDSPLHNRVVVRQLDSLHEQHKEIALLVQRVLAGQSELAEILRKNKGGQQEILAALERAILILERAGGNIVKIDRDVSGSIIIIGDGNRVSLSDGGYFADLWKETGSDPEVLLPQYLNVVAKAYADLDFPLGPLSQSIPLNEVYVDLPIVKPATDEALLHQRSGEQLSGELIRRADHLLQRNERSALVGILGTGKTTTLRYLTWIYAQRPEGKFYWRGESLVPFYVEIRDLAELWTKMERVNPEQFERSLAKGVSISMGGAFSARSIEIILHHALGKGNALVLLDALDEYKPQEHSEQKRSEFVRALQNLWSSSDFIKNNHILFTSRPYDFINPFGFAQYGLQNLNNAGRLVFRLGRAILKISHSNLSEEAIESWLQVLNEAVSQPRFREFSSPLYIMLMVYLGTSKETAKESVSQLKDIKRLSDPYRYFLRKTIEWEEKKGNESGVDPDTALLVLGYTAYDTFVKSVESKLKIDIVNELQTSKKEVTSVQEFWKRTGLLWEDESHRTLGFRHSGFQAFGVAFALTHMHRHSKAGKGFVQKLVEQFAAKIGRNASKNQGFYTKALKLFLNKDRVDELWDRYQWDPEWALIWHLYFSLQGGKAL